MAFGSHRQGWEDKANGKCDLPGFTGCVYINYIVFFKIIITYYLGFPGGSDGKESTCNAVDLGSIPGFGRFPGGGHGNPLHILAWRIPMDRGAWWATAQGVAKSWTRLSTPLNGPEACPPFRLQFAHFTHLCYRAGPEGTGICDP